MGFFNKKNEGGLMDIIRCDETQYLIQKWSPTGIINSTSKENSIRFGSKIRVKDGEIAVFVYQNKNGKMQDYLVGPLDETIKTANFPILTNILGSAFGGNSPFQAEIYFINLSGNIQLRFGIPYFDIYDPRFIDLGIPCSVRGTLTFNLTDYKKFIKLNRLTNFELDDFKNQIKDFFVRKAKSVVLNIPSDAGISVMQIERKIDEISSIIQSKLSTELHDDFGINLKRIDINAIELDKENSNYKQLKRITSDQQTKTIEAQTVINIENLEETMRIQRRDAELQVESKNFSVHQLNQQTEILKTAAQSLGEMGNIGSSGGLNPTGLLTGMMMGGVIGNQMSGMMNKINQAPPSFPTITYFIALNSQQIGSYSIEELKQLAKNLQFTKTHHVWKEGMPAWELATNVPEILQIFSSTPPPLIP